MGFYDQSITAANGEEISMKDYEGKVVLVAFSPFTSVFFI